MLEDFAVENFIAGIEKAYILIDFDARSGHNHGTKFRLRRNMSPDLYSHVEEF